MYISSWNVMRSTCLFFLLIAFSFLYTHVATSQSRFDYSNLAYSYQHIREAEIPLTFVSWEEGLEYVAWNNDTAEEALCLVCQDPKGFHIDHYLKSNQLTFYIEQEKTFTHERGKQGTRENGLWKNILVLGAVILSSRTAVEESASVREVGASDRVTRSISEPIFRKRDYSNSLSTLIRSKSISDLVSVRTHFAFRKEENILTQINPFKKMTPSHPVQGSLPLLASTEIKPSVSKGAFEGKEVVPSKTSYDHEAISSEVKEQATGKREIPKKKVTFSIPEPVSKPMPERVVRLVYSREEYEGAKASLQNKVELFKEKISSESYHNLSAEEQREQRKELAVLCGEAAHLIEMASQTIDHKKMEPMIHERCSEGEEKVISEDIQFPFKEINWSEVTQAEKHSIFLLDRANALFTTLYNFQDTLLVSEKEIGFALLETQKKQVHLLCLIDVAIAGVGRDRGRELQKRDKEIDQITDPQERIAEQEKLRVSKKIFREAWEGTIEKRKVNFACYKELSDRYDEYIRTGDESLISIQGVKAYEKAIEESFKLVSESIMLSSELTKILESKKKK